MPHGCISFGGSAASCCGAGCGAGAGARRAPSCYVPVVEGPGTDGRSPMSDYVPGAVFARSREALAQAEGWLAGAEAAGLGPAGLEAELAARGREIAQLLRQDHLPARAAAGPRLVPVAGPDGICRRRAGRGHDRTLASVPGPVTVSRIAYRAPG